MTMFGTFAASESNAEQMIAFKYNGKKVAGKVLGRDKAKTMVMRRDGRIVTLTNTKIDSPRVLKTSFKPASQSEIRGALLREHGSRFAVSGTGHYLVVHPKGQKEWVDRFESVYRSVAMYASTRRLKVTRPEFTMVAIVLPSRPAFEAYGRKLRFDVPQNVVGFYDPKSNRIVVYNMVAADGSSYTWSQNASTVIHEAAHQAAFNFGIHSRFARTPVWVAEGFATQFEAPGVWNQNKNTGIKSRINLDQLAIFRKTIADKGVKGWLPSMVGSNRFFEADTIRAYSAAWAASFYFAETQKDRYGAYLSKTAVTTEESSAERMKLFRSVFGPDMALLESKIMSFIDRLP